MKEAAKQQLKAAEKRCEEQNEVISNFALLQTQIDARNQAISEKEKRLKEEEALKELLRETLEKQREEEEKKKQELEKKIKEMQER